MPPKVQKSKAAKLLAAQVRPPFVSAPVPLPSAHSPIAQLAIVQHLLILALTVFASL
jgi:hypothetical protein